MKIVTFIICIGLLIGNICQIQINDKLFDETYNLQKNLAERIYRENHQLDVQMAVSWEELEVPYVYVGQISPDTSFAVKCNVKSVVILVDPNKVSLINEAVQSINAK